MLTKSWCSYLLVSALLHLLRMPILVVPGAQHSEQFQLNHPVLGAETSQPDFRGWRATIGRAPRDCSSHSLSSRELQTASHNQKKNGGSYTCDTWIGYNKGLKTGSVRLFISLVRRRKKNSRLLLAASVAQVWMCFLIMVLVSTMSGLTYRPKGYHACRYMSLSGVGWIVSHLCVWELQAKRIGFQSWIPIWNKSRHLFPGEGWDIEGH